MAKAQSRRTTAVRHLGGVRPTAVTSGIDASAELMRLVNGYQLSHALQVAATRGIADQTQDERRPYEMHPLGPPVELRWRQNVLNEGIF